MAVDQHLGQFNAQELSNTAWALATARLQDTPLFAALARSAESCTDTFSAQGLANTAWAFAITGELPPDSLDPISMLDQLEARGDTPKVMYYQMSVQGLLAYDEQLWLAFELVARAEANELLSQFRSDEKGYLIVHTLLAACRAVSDCG